MLTQNLYETVLINGVAGSGSELFAVSGYASATFANRHLSAIQDAKINLIIGMPGRRTDHSAYVSLATRFGDRFNAYYYNGRPNVHSKVYAWYQDGQPVIGYSGSGNYSQPGFFSQYQINQFIEDDPEQIRAFFNQLLVNCTPIEDASFPDLADVFEDVAAGDSVLPGRIEWEVPQRRVRISFLQANGTLPQKSGLNWGIPDGTSRRPFRAIGDREAYDQAYLPVRQDARDEGFLPETAYTFTLVTDDNQSIDCVVAQSGRKAIHSTLDNSEIGRYFRSRLGVGLGEPVTAQHLIQYGRTDYTLSKIDEETFLLDFSV